jgi:hypothetical protein
VPGTDTYDWWAINKALQNAGMGDGSWNIAGSSHSPVQTGSWVRNPAYQAIPGASQEELDQANAGTQPFIYQAGNTSTISVVNSKTGQIFKLTLGKQPLTPGGDPNAGYSYAISDYSASGTIDKANPGGYKDIQRESFADGHDELWGTNTQTGAFEKMPNSPDSLGNLKGWSDVKQVDDGQGHLTWVGTNPQGQPFQPVPNAPSVNTAKYVPGTVRQVTKNGRQVYVGQNATTQAFEDIPELGSEGVPIKTTTAGGKIYKENPNAGQPGQPDFLPVSGIATPNDGDRQWTDAGGGYVKQQVFTNGVWSDVGPDDPNGTWRPVNPATVRADTAAGRADAAIKPAGTKYYVPLTGQAGTLIQVTADGNGGFDYVPGPDGQIPTMKVAGALQPTDVSAGATSQFLPPRRDPVSGKVIPGEPNPNWTPTDVGDRTRQLQELARQKQAELHQQVSSGALTDQAADQQFNQWWDTEITPRQQAITTEQQRTQQTDQITANQEQRAQESQRMNLYTTAQAQGQQALQNYMAQQKNMVGPGFQQWGAQLGQAIASGGKPPPVNPADFTYQAPDFNQLAQHFTAQALKYISPTAANMTGTQPIIPNVASGVDSGSLLNRTQYLPSHSQGGVTININGGQTDQTGQAGQQQSTTATPQQFMGQQSPGMPSPDQWGRMMGNFGLPAPA